MLGIFFDRLRMSERKSWNEREKELDENSEGLPRNDIAKMPKLLVFRILEF